MTLLMSLKIEKNVNDAKWISKAHRETNEMINEWMGKRIVIDVVNYKEKVMTRDQNWAFSARVVGTSNKKK